VCIFPVTFVGNKQRCKAHESGVENINGNVEIQHEIACCLGPRPNNCWSPVKQLCKQNTTSLEVSLKKSSYQFMQFQQQQQQQQQHRNNYKALKANYV